MNRSVQSEVSRQLLNRFLVQIIIFALLFTTISAVGYLLCSKRTWYSWDPFYPVIHFLHLHWSSCFLFFLFLGCIIISCINFYRIARIMAEMTLAVDDLYSDRVTSVSLSPELHEIEKKLNQIMINIRESNQAANEANQRKNDMIVYMAHDLKTPLTSVIGYLTLLKDEPQISEEVRQKYLTIAWNKAERLETLINQFFEITRFNLSQMTLDYTTINMSMMVEQILYEFKPLFQEKELDYIPKIMPDIMVSCDVDKIERIFDNLIKNAMNYSYVHTSLEVSLFSENQKHMHFIIKNHGKTIPKEKLALLFEQFFRLDSSRSSSTGGTGLGLAISKQITELHQGKITCESEQETITFHLILPLNPEIEKMEM